MGDPIFERCGRKAMKIDIKEALPENLNQINELLRISKAYWGYDAVFLDRFMERLGITDMYMQQHAIKLFCVDDYLAGFFNFGFNADGLFELDNFFLHPNYIGKGIGRMLRQACCQEAKKQRKNEFIIWSDPNAEKFYVKMGCEKIGVRQSPMMPDRYPPILKFKL
jgi:streptomycin 6-kinase